MINDRHDPIIAAYLNDFKGTDGILSDEKQRELAISMNKEVVMARAYKSSLKDKTISVNTKRRLNSQLYELLETIEPQRRKLTETNLPFVVSTAKRYTNQGLSFLDLIQVGSEAMYEKATIQYDPFHELNSKFVSYAAWWVRQGMIRAIGDQSTTIRIPVHKRDTINKIKIFSNRFFSKHGRLPHSDEISKSIGIPADKVEFALENSQEISSLDAPVHETNGKNLSDITSY